MEIRVHACPSCDAPVTPGEKSCKFCKSVYMISSFSSLSDIDRSKLRNYSNAYSSGLKDDPDDPSLNHSIGICYISLGLYDKALASFEKVMDFDPENSFGYYAAAICLLKGRSAFLNSKKDVDKAIEYLNAATMIEELGKYHYLMAYLKYDYYKRKFLRTEPDYSYHLNTAYALGISDEDIFDIFNQLKVNAPEGF